MDKQIISSSQPAFEEVHRKLESWRKIKRHLEPIPKDIWQAAADLARKHSVNTVSKALRLSYTDLKDRVCGPSKSKPKNKRRPDFIEIGQPFLIPEATLEMENKKGSHLKISFKGRTDFDLMALAKTFLQKNL